jgi:ribosomal protein L11 methyltransferase
MASWQQVSVIVPAHQAERLSDWFSDYGALSVTLEDAADQPVYEPKPGETPIWQATRVVALFDDELDSAALHHALLAQQGPACARTLDEETIEDRAWERAWLDHFQPMRFGRRLWICPSALELPAEAEGGVCVSLDPGLAFGTGTHATTALCLEWLDGQELAGKTVLDYGCGSGVLAVAALLLGAANATGVDIDAQALLASADNAGKNGVAERLACLYPEQMPADFQADIVLANILANPLVELAPRLAGYCKPGGHIVLSGLLAEQAEQVSLAYQAYFQLAPVRLQDGWACLSGSKPKAHGT